MSTAIFNFSAAILCERRRYYLLVVVSSDFNLLWWRACSLYKCMYVLKKKRCDDPYMMIYQKKAVHSKIEMKAMSKRVILVSPYHAGKNAQHTLPAPAIQELRVPHDELLFPQDEDGATKSQLSYLSRQPFHRH